MFRTKQIATGTKISQPHRTHPGTSAAPLVPSRWAQKAVASRSGELVKSDAWLSKYEDQRGAKVLL